jgi:ABC-type Zn uptake system ZnuABC Zn-binding protein ZnuA
MRHFFLLLVVVCLLCVACTEDAKPGSTPTPTPTNPPISVDHSADPLTVVVSLPIFADMVREVAGDQAKVSWIVPPGVDPHTYSPNDDSITTVGEAQMIFYNGNGLEAPTQQFLEAHRTQPGLFINFTHNVPSPSTEQPIGTPVYAEQVGDDPHLFLDPQLATIYPETIAGTFAIKDGENTAYYDARFRDYKQRILDMGQSIKEKLDTIPAANKGKVIIYHNSLIHFANRYGLTVAGTVVDNGADGLAQIIAEQHPPAVFTETGYDTSVLEQVAAAAGIPVCNLETDSIANLGTNYLDMMQHNADELVRCLNPS